MQSGRRQIPDLERVQRLGRVVPSLSAGTRAAPAPGQVPVQARVPAGPPAPPHPRPAAGQPKAKRPSLTSRIHPAVWVGIGFIAGVAFWHLIGFWSFVNGIVFKEERRSGLELSSAEDGRKLPTTVLGGIPAADAPNPSACTNLRLDRVTNRTTLGSCDPVQSAVTPSSTIEKRGAAEAAPRKVPSVAGWSIDLKNVPRKD